MRVVTLFFGLFLLVSCSSSSDKDCLDSKTIMAIVNPGNEFATVGFKQVYSNVDYRIFASKYLTPNGDGIRDNFGFFIVKNDNTAYFNYPDLEIDHVEKFQVSGKPTDFFSEGSLRISNNCDLLFSSDNINQLIWAPHYMANTAEGSYKVNLKLKLDDNTLIDINTTTEVLKSFYPKD